MSALETHPAHQQLYQQVEQFLQRTHSSQREKAESEQCEKLKFGRGSANRRRSRRLGARWKSVVLRLSDLLQLLSRLFQFALFHQDFFLSHDHLHQHRSPPVTTHRRRSRTQDRSYKCWDWSAKQDPLNLHAPTFWEAFFGSSRHISRITDHRCIHRNTYTHIHSHFTALFSGLPGVSQCQKKSSSELYGAREDNRGRHADNPFEGRGVVWEDNQQLTS